MYLEFELNTFESDDENPLLTLALFEFYASQHIALASSRILLKIGYGGTNYHHHIIYHPAGRTWSFCYFIGLSSLKGGVHQLSLSRQFSPFFVNCTAMIRLPSTTSSPDMSVSSPSRRLLDVRCTTSGRPGRCSNIANSGRWYTSACAVACDSAQLMKRENGGR